MLGASSVRRAYVHKTWKEKGKKGEVKDNYKQNIQFSTYL
jgi:hypothetical protein